MKITQSWRENAPNSAGGYGVTISYTYSSNIKSEIDEIIKKLPKGMIVIDTDKTQRTYPRSAINELD